MSCDGFGIASSSSRFSEHWIPCLHKSDIATRSRNCMSPKLAEPVFGLLAKLLRLLIRSNVRLSASFDRLLPRRFRIDGHTSFRNDVVWSYVRPGMWIYDVGGGKHPFIDQAKKKRSVFASRAWTWMPTNSHRPLQDLMTMLLVTISVNIAGAGTRTS